MDSEYIKQLIEGTPFFKEFSDHEKNKLAGDSNTFKQFEKGENIFIQGDDGFSLFVVLLGSIELIKICDVVGQEGRVSLKKEEEKTVGELETGSVFGEISMLTGRKRSVTARVVSAKAVVMEISDKLVELVKDKKWYLERETAANGMYAYKSFVLATVTLSTVNDHFKNMANTKKDEAIKKAEEANTESTKELWESSLKMWKDFDNEDFFK